MHVVPLRDRELLVHTATRIDDATFDAIDALGTPTILFAPNHFHHLGVPAYRKRYPGAEVVAAATAIPRLTKQGHAGVRSTDDVKLPDGVRWLEPRGTKNGESWLSIDDDSGRPTWLISDGFFHATQPITGIEGIVLRQMKAAPGLSIGFTFKLMGIANAAEYMDWVSAALDRERPKRILFSHGEPLEEDAVGKLRQVLRKRL